MLKNRFYSLCQNFTNNEELISTLWREIDKAHTVPTRHYHTLIHLKQIYKALPTINIMSEFAIFYHDIVYDASRNDNEEKSACLCEKRLKYLKVSTKLRSQVIQLIRETKTHEASSPTNALFLDADLAILGSTWESYENYLQNVRKEYLIYSDDVYNVGRKKVLKQFLKKERIYISEYFYERYEQQARKNIEQELLIL